jgi:hypothetical protein
MRYTVMIKGLTYVFALCFIGSNFLESLYDAEQLKSFFCVLRDSSRVRDSNKGRVAEMSFTPLKALIKFLCGDWEFCPIIRGFGISIPYTSGIEILDLLSKKMDVDFLQER